MPTTTTFAFSDTSTFEQNIATFSAELIRLDAIAGPVLRDALPLLANGVQDKDTLLDVLDTALSTPPVAQAQLGQGQPPGAPPATPPHATIHWFLEGLEIEGFRGINNEGAPLALKFKPECVSSISAPNGVGKSSIYDALSFALRGKIDKLDRLLQAERGQDYYLNRFHPAGVGTVKLVLRPDNGGPAATLTITRNMAGQRSVTGHVSPARRTEPGICPSRWTNLPKLHGRDSAQSRPVLLRTPGTCPLFSAAPTAPAALPHALLQYAFRH
jgi:hypothetical protein